MNGPLGFKGRLELTEKRLSFKPTTSLDRLVGAKAWQVDVLDIDVTRIAGLQRSLYVETKDGSERFMGKGAQQVHERLASLLRHIRGEAGAEDAYSQSERVLMQGDINRYVTSVVAVPGKLELTDRRLRFIARRGIETLIWSDADVDTPLELITAASRSGAQMKLALTIGDEVVAFEGGVCSAIYARLIAQHGKDMQEERGIIVDSWLASLCTGPVMAAVDLVVSSRRVVLAVKGKLDAAAGFRDRVVSLGDIGAIAVEGWPEQRLRFEVRGSSSVELAMPDMDRRFAQFVDLLSASARADILVPGDEQQMAHGVLAASKLQLRGEEEVRMLSPVLAWESSAEVVRSWLVLTTERAIIVPWDEQDAESGVVAYNFDQLARDDLGEDQYGPTVHLTIDGEPFAMTLIDDQQEPEHIYAVLDLQPPAPSSTRISSVSDAEPTPLPVHLAPESTPVPSSRPTIPPPPDPLPAPAHDVDSSHLQGKAIFLRLIAEDGNVVTLRRRARLTLDAMGTTYLVPGARRDALKLGSKLKVALGRPEGLYAFASRVVEPADGPDSQCLAIALPRRIRSFDRRRFFRQSMNTVAKVRFMEEGEDGTWKVGEGSTEVELIDVSRGGFAIRTTCPLGEGDHLIWMMPQAKRVNPVEAVCVRVQKITRRSMARDASEPADTPSTVWQYGLEFVQSSAELVEAVDLVVSGRVRSRWIERGVRNPSGFQRVFETEVYGWTCSIEVDPTDPRARMTITAPAGDKSSKRETVSADANSHVTATVCPVRDFQRAILQSGLKFSPSEERSIGGALRSLAANPSVAPVVIATGIEPIEGHSGQVHWMVPIGGADRLSVDHFVDLHEVEVFVNVGASDVICAFTDPHCGMPGRDVFGEAIPPPALPSLPLGLGDGVHLEKGTRRVLSTAGGCVNFDGKSLSVAQVYTVKGDVDFTVGNIQFDGNVVVTGNVIEGFKVAAAGDIDIGGIVDAATIVAGGSIRVGGGVTGHTRAYLRAGGEIRARYLNGVIVQAGRQITIERQIRNCSVLAGGGVVVQRGGIVGGIVRAAGSVQAQSLGSIRYVATTVAVGQGLVPDPQFGKVDSERRSLRKRIARLEEDIGHLLGHADLIARLNRKQRVVFAQRESKLLKARAELEQLETVLLDSRQAVDNRAMVLTMRDAYPNCQLQIGLAFTKTLDEHLVGEQSFCVDEELGVIVAHRR